MVYVTADLHGLHPQALQRLLAQADFSDADVLFILGDVIDRGEYGAQLLLWLTQQPNIYLILGNHEAQLLSCSFLFDQVNDTSLDAMTVQNLGLVENWLANGGGPTLKGFRKLLRDDPELMAGILEYLQDAPFFEQVEAGGREYILVHSGLGEHFDPRRSLRDYSPEELLFSRPSADTVYFPDKTTVFGHTPTFFYAPQQAGKPLYTGTWINIDVGVHAGHAPLLLRLDDLKEFYLDP